MTETKTLRDEFAMAAMIGLISKHGIAESAWATIAPDHNSKLAYIVADAMLLERQKKPDTN